MLDNMDNPMLFYAYWRHHATAMEQPDRRKFLKALEENS